MRSRIHVEVMPVQKLKLAQFIYRATGWIAGGGILTAMLIQAVRFQRDQAHAEQHLQTAPAADDKLTTPPLVTVLVAAWNETRNIAAFMESFLRLTYPNKQLVLCAGGQDETYALASQLAGDNVIVLQQQLGEGKQRALRRAYAQASGDIIYLTDADCLLDDASFTQVLRPIINESEHVVTGNSAPLLSQRDNTFVLHRWFIEVYTQTRMGEYVDGLLGRNAAITRTALDHSGGFAPEVATGTDYHMAKSLLQSGYRIRYAANSVIQTEYAKTLSHYRTQQGRWLRNVVLHGAKFGAGNEVFRATMPSIIGAIMLFGPVLSLMAGAGTLILWLPLWVFVTLSRVRYMRYSERLTGVSFRHGYMWLPVYTFIDFCVWVWVLFDYPIKTWRTKWR